MDWKNVDLTDDYQRDQSILDAYDFSTLLLEINCNLKTINEGTVAKLFEDNLKIKIASAREIFKYNLTNIVNFAKKERP